MRTRLRSVVIAALSTAAGIVTAQVNVSLKCELLISKTYSGREFQRETVSTIFDVYQDKLVLSIIPQSDDFSSVSTMKHKNITNIRNLSDKNKWDLWNNLEINGAKKSETKITINRNTGDIFYYREFIGEDLPYIEQGAGTCTKIDTSKRKF